MKVTRFKTLYQFLVGSIALFSTIHTIGYVAETTTIQRLTMLVDYQEYGIITGFANQPITKPTNPTKDGYTFDNWYKDSSFLRPFTFDFMPSQNTTVYGKYTINQYTLTFQFNNDIGNSSSRLNFGSVITLPTTPVRNGFIFGGWYLDSLFSNPFLNNFMPARDLTLHAKWTARNYAITFNTNGGSIIAPKTTPFNELIEITSPTRVGHTFAGWFTDIALTQPFNQARMPSQDLTLYAKWTVNTYQITFNSNQGSSISDLTNVLFGSSINAPNNPTRSGFIFLGWYRDANLTQLFTFSTMPAENLTLFAKWDVVRFNVIFEVNGGVTLPNLAVEPATTIPSLPTPLRSGYEFAGWFSNSNLTTPFTTTSMPNQNVTIYAKWILWTVTKLETSINTTLAISSTGKLFGWGQNVNGLLGEPTALVYQTPTPINLPTLNQGETVLDIQIGGTHALLITSTGRIFAWGDNASGQLGDGSVSAKSTPTLITFSSLSSNERITSIAAGFNHSLAITSLGRVFAWGANASGQLGNGTTNLRSTPTLISVANLNSSETIISVYAGLNHSMVLTSSSRVFAWGANADGELGIGSTSSANTPTLVSFTNLNQGETISNLYVGEKHSFALTSSKRVWSWGANNANQINNSSSVRLTSPTLVSFSGLIQGETISSLIPGGQHSLAITSNARVYAWGDNDSGQLGNGLIQRLQSPTFISIPNLSQGETISSIHAGFKHTFAITSNNQLYAWGLNTQGQLGDYSLVSKSTPRIITISMLGDSAYSLQTNLSNNSTSFLTTTQGHVYGWGQNQNGKLGDDSTIFRTSPVKVNFTDLSPGEHVLSIKSGNLHSIALTNQGKIFSWGDGSSGALGTGGTTSRLIPTVTPINALISNEIIVAIEVGGNHSLALTSNGRVFGWGLNSRGQLGIGSTINSLTPTLLTFPNLLSSERIQSIHAGNEHNFAITTNGRVFGWGFNASNVLGNNTSVNSTVSLPTLFTFNLNQGETITKIYPGITHNFAITSAQRVFAWGLNSSGQLGLGNSSNRTTPTLVDFSGSLTFGETMVDFALGSTHSIAITSSGRVFTWGNNSNGQLGNGTTSSSSTPVLVSVTLSSSETISSIGASQSYSFLFTSRGRIFELGSSNSNIPTVLTVTYS